MLTEKELNDFMDKYYNDILFYIERPLNYIYEDRKNEKDILNNCKTVNDLVTFNLEEQGKTEEYYLGVIKINIFKFLNNELKELELYKKKYILNKVLEKVLERIKQEKVEELLILYKLGRM